MTDQRWVILILRDDDVTRYYTGLRDENDLRIFANTADDERTLAYIAQGCALNDLRGLMHDGIRAWVEERPRALHRDARRVAHRLQGART